MIKDSVENVSPPKPVEVLGFFRRAERGTGLSLRRMKKSPNRLPRNACFKNVRKNYPPGDIPPLMNSIIKLPWVKLKELNIIIKGDVQGSIERYRNRY